MIQHLNQFVVFSKALSSHRCLPRVVRAFEDKNDARAFSYRSHKYGEATKVTEFLTNQASVCVNLNVSVRDALDHFELASVARKHFIEKYEIFNEIKRYQRTVYKSKSE